MEPIETADSFRRFSGQFEVLFFLSASSDAISTTDLIVSLLKIQ